MYLNHTQDQLAVPMRDKSAHSPFALPIVAVWDVDSINVNVDSSMAPEPLYNSLE